MINYVKYILVDYKLLCGFFSQVVDLTIVNAVYSRRARPLAVIHDVNFRLRVHLHLATATRLRQRCDIATKSILCILVCPVTYSVCDCDCDCDFWNCRKEIAPGPIQQRRRCVLQRVSAACFRCCTIFK